MPGIDDEERLRLYDELNPVETYSSTSSSCSDSFDSREEVPSSIGTPMMLTNNDVQQLAKYSCDVGGVKHSISASDAHCPTSKRTAVMRSIPPIRLGTRMPLRNEFGVSPLQRFWAKIYSSIPRANTTKDINQPDCLESDQKEFSSHPSHDAICQDDCTPCTCASVLSDCSGTSTHSKEPHRVIPASSQEQSKFGEEELSASASASREHPCCEKHEVLLASGEVGKSCNEGEKTSEISSSASTKGANIPFLGLGLSSIFMVVGHVNSPSTVPPRVRSHSVNFPVLNPAQETVARDVGRILRRLSDEFTTQMSNRGQRRRTISLPVDCPTCRSEGDPSPPSSLQ